MVLRTCDFYGFAKIEDIKTPFWAKSILSRLLGRYIQCNDVGSIYLLTAAYSSVLPEKSSFILSRGLDALACCMCFRRTGPLTASCSSISSRPYVTKSVPTKLWVGLIKLGSFWLFHPLRTSKPLYIAPPQCFGAHSATPSPMLSVLIYYIMFSSLAQWQM